MATSQIDLKILFIAACLSWDPKPCSLKVRSEGTVTSLSSKEQFQNLISEWDSLVRQGQLNRVAEQIRQINLQQIPRESRKSFASVCRRAGLIAQGLRVLQPVIRQQDQNPTPEETCEYGALLMRNGSLWEAMKLFTSVDTKQLPLSLLYQGFCHIYSWDYEAAVPLFEATLDSSIDDYSKLIALVNLGASLSSLERSREALEVVNRAIESASQVKALRLVGNCLEIRAQIHISENNFAAAKQDLHEAHAMFDQNKNYDLLLISKYRALIQATEENSLSPLIQFKADALAKKHWESVRDADFFTLKICFDRKLFDHLVFGSPMQGYRKRVLRKFPQEPSSHYVFGSDGFRVLDLESGQGLSEDGLHPGQKVHAVIAALVADFYAPRDTGTMFSILYPNEYFDIASSPGRVRQAIYRARAWLRSQHISAEILQDGGQYRFFVNGDFGVRVPYAKIDLQTDAIRFLDMKKALPPGRPFTVGDACASLQISRSTFHRLVQYGLETCQLRRVGVKRSTAYIFES